MSTTEIKEKLIRQIRNSENEDLLEELYHFLNEDNSFQKAYELSKVQILAVEEARAQFEKGLYLSNEKANQDIEKWLKK